MTVDAEVVAALDALRAQTGASRHSLLLAALEALLFRHTGQEDFLVGIPVALRGLAETRDLVGFLVNTQTWRAGVASGMTFRELAGRVHQTGLDAYANQDVPFDKLVEDLQPERAAGHTPLFQVMFVYHNVLLRGLQLPGLQVRTLDCHNRTAKFDLLLELQDTPEGLRGFWEFSTDLFEAETIARMSRHFVTLLRAAATQPETRVGDLPLLAPEEKNRLLKEWNSTSAEIPPVGLHDLFTAQAARTPTAAAVVAPDGATLTYAELDRRSDALAARLPVNPDDCVGLCFERSLDMAVAVLAVLKAGAACVPLDPAYPAERLRLMLEDACAALVLASRKHRNVLGETTTPCFCPEDIAAPSGAPAPRERAKPENLAYVIFTSGSTGRPKGVAMPHRALVNLVEWHWRAGHARGLKTLQFAPLSFDVSFQEMFTTWAGGGTLVLISEETRRDPRALLHCLSERGIERLFLPFVALQQLAETAAAAERLPLSLREIITAGEQLQITPGVAALFDRLPGCALHNHYEPTESHVVTAFTLAGAPEAWPALPPIGRPIANTRVYILDAQRQPVPVGVTGELFIAGDCLARGYLHRPELTAERFMPDPFSTTPEARLYRTGDAARWRADGQIEFLGRLDQQVKIRGFRVELGEIESVLGAQPGVKQCAVALREDRPGDKRLVAYVVPAAAPAPDPAEWSRRLKARLPDYMVPAAFVTLEALPRTPSGKVDRRAVPPPSETQTACGREIIAPRDAWERELVAVWEKILGVQPVSVNDDFFALGGHSLLAARMFAELEQELGLHLPLAVLFEASTVEQLAAAIRRRKQTEPWQLIVPIQPRGARPPMFWMHTLGGGGGGGLLRYRALANLLGPDQPSFGIEAPREPFTDIPAMAAHYVAAIRQHQPRGPYFLGGYCFGGVVACEMARQLETVGETVGLLAVLDSATPAIARGEVPFRLRYLPTAAANVWFKMTELARGGPAKLRARLRQRFEARGPRRPRGLPSLALGDIIDMRDYPEGYRHYAEIHWKALIEFRPEPYPGKLVLFRARHQSLFNFDPTSGFGEIARGGVRVIHVPGVHETLLEEPTVAVLAADLRACLEAAQAKPTAPSVGN